MYRKIDGIAMGSPLGPALANIFVGYYESKLFNKISKPTVYCRYVDDTFSLFHKETEFQKFLNCLNSLHPSKFTNEIETNNSLPFLDVLVTKSDNKFITSVYQKPTFTGQYIHWNSFGPKQRKTNLIDTLTHQALKICYKSTLKHELENIRSILVKIGYPEFLIDLRISKKLLCFQQSTKEDPKKMPCLFKIALDWRKFPEI